MRKYMVLSVNEKNVVLRTFWPSPARASPARARLALISNSVDSFN